jgi:hypothetical protein
VGTAVGAPSAGVDSTVRRTRRFSSTATVGVFVTSTRVEAGETPLPPTADVGVFVTSTHVEAGETLSPVVDQLRAPPPHSQGELGGMPHAQDTNGVWGVPTAIFLIIQ